MEATRVVSSAPAKRWEDALISGNGATGIMVFGTPLDETIVVNHEKLWVMNAPDTREVVDMRAAMAEARRLAKSHQFEQAERMLHNTFAEANRKRYGPKSLEGNKRIQSDKPHPGFHLRLAIAEGGDPASYRREMVLDTGEVVVAWEDDRGAWERRAFVSRPHDAVVLQVRRPMEAKLTCTLRLTEAPGKRGRDIGSVKIEHRDGELYFHSAYGRTGGRPEPEGYHALARVVCRGGRAAARDDRIEIADADELLVILRLEYLDRASAADVGALRKALAALPDSYDALLAPHAKVHGEMFRRVRLDLGGGHGRGRPAEQILADAEKAGPTPELLELLHAVGRYALISSSGELPPALMGIWGNTWRPPWNGRYTFDSNINLAISAGSQGNMPEAMGSYFGFIESLCPDWATNAQALYGCRGTLSDIAQGWRHGLAMHGWFGWTGGPGWLSTYFYDHYLYTGDREFLRQRVVPLLKQVALFYEDFLKGMEGDDGRYVFYPSISPENRPSRLPAGGKAMIAPNATSEIAICRRVLTSLVAACRELGIEAEAIPRWEAMLAKLPDYRINEDGALAEWSYPGVGDNYNHRHGSHFFGVYPGIEIGPHSTPELYKAARRALELKVKAGMGNKSAHGLMHNAFFAARFRDPAMLWRLMDFYARNRYANRSLVSSHNPNRRIYNLDATLSWPAVLMEMLVHSTPGHLILLPALPADRLPTGRIEGVKARGQIVVESLAWDIPAARIDLRLSSGREQTVALSGPRPIGSVTIGGDAGEALPPREGQAGWRLHLPAGEAVQSTIRLGGEASRDSAKE